MTTAVTSPMAARGGSLAYTSDVPLPTPPKGLIRIRVSHTTGTKVWGTGWWVDMGSTDTPSSADLDAFCEAIEDLWNAQISAAFTTTTVYQSVSAEWHDGAGNIVQGLSANPLAGTNANTKLPLSICFVLSWRIAASYRGGKPRSYLSGMAETLLDGTSQFWTAAIVAAFQAGAAAVLSGVNALTISAHAVSMGELSYFEDAAERFPAPAPVVRTVPLFRPFTAVVARAQIGHQRLRDRA